MHSLAEAHVVIADLTDLNPNVFYELGIRHALSRRSILICEKGTEIPSDLKNYWYFEYDRGSKQSLQSLRTFITDALREIDGDPSKPDSPVADFLRTHRVQVSREEKDHYHIATTLVADAVRRLYVIERTPVLLVQDIRTQYHQKWYDALKKWVDVAVRDSSDRSCGLLFVASKTAEKLKTKRERSQFEMQLRQYKKLEGKGGRGGVVISAMPQYCGSFIVADDRVGIWYKTATAETGIYVSELAELADAYQEVFFRLCGDVRQTEDEILQLVDSFRQKPNL